MQSLAKNKSQWPCSVVRASMEWEVLSGWQSAHAIWSYPHVLALCLAEGSCATNRELSRVILSIKPTWDPCTYMSDLRFPKGPGAGTRRFGHLRTGKGGKWKGRRTGWMLSLLVLMASLQLHHLWPSLLWLLYLSILSPKLTRVSYQNFLTDDSIWRDTGGHMGRKSRQKLCIQEKTTTKN